VRLIRRLAIGAGAGIGATAAMTAVMLAARRVGLVTQLAPETITEAALDRTGVASDPPTEVSASAATHFAFGAAMGAVFAAVEPLMPVPRSIRGPAYGLGVLLVSYQGWVPAAGILPPLSEQRSGGRDTLIASHVVYGLVLGRLVRTMSR
jgi:hypothetical protein